MPFCPRCKSEYTAGMTECADCKIKLVEERPHDPSPPEGDVELAEIFTAQSPVSAYAVKDRLESVGIPAMIKTMDTTYYDGMMVHMYGFWGKVYVKKEDLERAAQIIEEAMAQMKDEPKE